MTRRTIAATATAKINRQLAARRAERAAALEAALALSPAGQRQAAIAGTVPDELNPSLAFSGIAAEILVAIADGRIDAVALAKNELAGRSLDRTGAWTTPAAAAAAWK